MTYEGARLMVKNDGLPVQIKDEVKAIDEGLKLNQSSCIPPPLPGLSSGFLDRGSR